MEIMGSKIEQVKIEISEDSLIEHTINIIRNNSTLRHGTWIEDGKVCIERHTSHSWTEELADATPQEKIDYKIIQYLEKLRNKLRKIQG